MNYPKGSEWRKWDLHIHTKADQGYTFAYDSTISKREENDDEYPKVFIEHIYTIDNLGAVAITDHNKSTEGWISTFYIKNFKKHFLPIWGTTGSHLNILHLVHPHHKIQLEKILTFTKWDEKLLKFRALSGVIFNRHFHFVSGSEYSDA